MYYMTKPVAAHRYAFMKAYGLKSLERDQFVCHHCDNPKCVNPKHLFLGTNSDNMRDKLSKGRHRAPVGSQHGRAKLNEAEVAAIRESDKSASELAAGYAVHPQHIRLIRRKKRIWKHV